MKMTRTSSRKQRHVAIMLTKDVSFRSKVTGFNRWDFQHNALPELNLSDINPCTSFLGKTIALPFIISSMTGGYAKAKQINQKLAEICAYKKLALGVGSQRQALEESGYHHTYSVVRDVAPDIPLFGNIGAAEIANLRDPSTVLRMIDLIRADGFAVHLNPLQELLQPEGNTNFSGVLAGIEMLARSLPIPLIVKEIGAGISGKVAQQLINAGVTIIDVAGAGGTSWAGVEIVRREGKKGKKKKIKVNEKMGLDIFWDWGIPTVDALREVCALKSGSNSIKVIASGGISNGIDIAKSLAFRADYAAAARPILITLAKEGLKAVLHLIDEWEKQLKGVMFLTGSRCIADLQKQQLYLKA